MAGQASGGYEAHAAGLDEIANRLRQFGEDMNDTAAEAANPLNPVDPAAFGDLRAAWSHFSSEWGEAANWVADDFSDLTSKVQASAGTYRNAEQRATALMQGFFAGGS